MSAFPRTVQVEVTNRCNFSCTYCIRGFWNVEEGEMDLHLFKKLSEELRNANKVVLYGLGEPLTHENFIDIAMLARSSMNDGGQIVFSTNGDLLDERIANKLVREIGVDRISFSLDTADNLKLEKLRVGANGRKILENLRYLSKIKKDSRLPLSIAIEVVLMKDNLQDLPGLIELAAENGVDFVTITNVVTYSVAFGEQQLSTTTSRRPYEIAKNILDSGWQIIHDSAAHLYSISHTGRDTKNPTDQYTIIWNKARNEGYWINLPMLLIEQQRTGMIENVEKVFGTCVKTARDKGVRLELPNLFADAKSRSCPYIENDATMIRADGNVVPCQEFAYQHQEYVNHHLKDVFPVVFGNIREQPLEKIWNSDRYVMFRQLRHKMRETIPWCGDCIYSTSNCFYVRSNKTDCQATPNSCSECLFSAHIAKCML
ncbi:MAG: radical SAM protein [Nitrososphaeria archaeon]